MEHMPEMLRLLAMQISASNEAMSTNQQAIISLLGRDAPASRVPVGEAPAPGPPAAEGAQAKPPADPPDLPKNVAIKNEDHCPPRVDQYDFMRSEKSVAIYLSKNRLEPYDRDITYQLDELKGGVWLRALQGQHAVSRRAPGRQFYSRRDRVAVRRMSASFWHGQRPLAIATGRAPCSKRSMSPDG